VNRLRSLLFAAIILFFTSCGIEDDYRFLPQVPPVLNTTFNTEAVFVVPPIQPDFIYIHGFKIFYKIYLSDSFTESIDDLNEINPLLLRDYNSLKPFTDPENLTTITTLNTFSSRDYFELDNTIGRNGGTFNIIFHTDEREYPDITLNNGNPEPLRRSSRLSLTDEQFFFLNTANLRDIENVNNADVALNEDASFHAYTSMYIVAYGVDLNFSEIYGKPTFINIFKLPNVY